MTFSPARIARRLKQRISEQLPKRDDSGLTTLEWLLIVAAVAGLAALAVVLVQNVVSDTSEQIAGSSARKTAAQIAATEIMADADRNAGDQPDEADMWDEWISYYTGKCDRLKITYGDAGISVEANFVTHATTTDLLAANINTRDVTAATMTAAASTAEAHCRVT